MKCDEEGFLGGTILYCTKQVVHAQYIHFTDRGKEIGSFDLLMDQVLEIYKDRKYFDFGISRSSAPLLKRLSLSALAHDRRCFRDSRITSGASRSGAFPSI